MNDRYDETGGDAAFWGSDDTPTAQIRRIGRDVTSQIRRVVPERPTRRDVTPSGGVRRHRSGPGAGDTTGRQQRRRDADTSGAFVRRNADAAPLHLSPYDYDLADGDGYAGLASTQVGADQADDARWAALDAWVTPEPIEPVRRRATGSGTGVDPRLLRVGALVAAVVAMIPVAAALGGGDDEAPSVAAAAVEVPAVAPQPTTPETIAITAAVVPVAADSTNDDAAADGATASGGASDRPAVRESPAAVATTEPRPVCAGQYTVVAGDYWLRLAADGGGSTDEWLAANDANLQSPLYPGDQLCIPAGASAPAPPTTVAPTTAPPTTAAPTTAAPVTTAAPATTAAPVTTAAPGTTAAPPVSGSPEQIIRSIFPDDQEDYAIEIARRESGLNPAVDNGWCCYGLFQIYFNVNRGWLADLGITSAEQLRDPYLNTLAAYTLWQSSGWSPWSTHTG
ncbi:MAG: LysM peptidoglycan-binding domain-containing protein [Desertimonas sp.]